MVRHDQGRSEKKKQQATTRPGSQKNIKEVNKEKMSQTDMENEMWKTK
jgi:hypothetical protein